MTPTTQPGPAGNPPPAGFPVLKVFGLGSAGLNILEELSRHGLNGNSLVAVHADTAALAGCSAAEKIHIQNNTTRGNKVPDPGAGSTAEDQLPRLKSLCSGADVVFIIAGLGGSVGTCLSGVLASAAREAGAFVLSFVMLPFDCEGTLRAQLADAGLDRLKQAADLVICWPNQKTFGLIEEGTSLLDTFKASNRLLATSVRGAWRAFSCKPAMGVSFMDLCSSIRTHSSECVFSIAEATGANRAVESLDRLFQHPMVKGLKPLEKSQAIAVCVLGGTDLAMTEVNRIMEQVHQHFDDTPVLMGAAITPDAGESLLIALMMSRPNQKEEEIEDEPDPPASGRAEGLEIQFLDRETGTRPQSRFVPPAPSLPQEKMAQLLKQQTRNRSGGRKVIPKFRQTQLPLEIISKGRFDKSEPTIHKGEDLDVPTYIRRGVSLN